MEKNEALLQLPQILLDSEYLGAYADPKGREYPCHIGVRILRDIYKMSRACNDIILRHCFTASQFLLWSDLCTGRSV